MVNQLSKEDIDKLQAAHGQVFELEAAGEFVYVRKPRRAEYRRFKDGIFDEKKKSQATEQLFLDVVVAPDRSAVDAMLDDKPALGDTFGAQVIKIAGGGIEAEQKKL